MREKIIQNLPERKREAVGWQVTQSMTKVAVFIEELYFQTSILKLSYHHTTHITLNELRDEMQIKQVEIKPFNVLVRPDIFFFRGRYFITFDSKMNRNFIGYL